jgi:integrase
MPSDTATARVRLLGRDDIVAFLNRMRYLVQRGEVAAARHVVDVRHLRRMLSRMRSLGLTQPGQPLHGLSEQFTLRPEDIPDDLEDTEAGRDLPPEVMRQLCDHLAVLGTGDVQARTAVELLMDTGRRPDEICKLPFDCLERDGDGEPVLIYDNRKAFRNGRRLPIAKATAALIVEQQQRVRARFSDTPVKDRPPAVAGREPARHEVADRQLARGPPPGLGRLPAGLPRPHRH